MNLAPAGTVETYDCTCGQCGLQITLTHPLRGPRRKYAVDCPYRQLRALDQRRKSSREAYERRRQQSPRKCSCGCGRELPRYVRFHPECESREGCESPRKVTVPGKGRCPECYDQGWRRNPVLGCLRCGRAYEPERDNRQEVSMKSSLGQCRG